MTSVWGPSLWEFIHRTCLHIEPYRARKVIYGVMNVIPCDDCFVHYRTYLATNPPSGDLFKWSVDCHNWVNYRLGKPIFRYDEALRKYS